MEEHQYFNHGNPNQIDIEIINPKEVLKPLRALVRWPWGQTMKASISIEKEKIKLKGEGNKVIVPIFPSQEKPWEEPNENEGDIRRH